jgi:hygromycin-B 4-O-kinase
MHMPDLRPEVEDREVLGLLARHFDGPVTRLEPLEGGQIARTFAFAVGGEDFVLRVDRRLGANVEKQAFVARLLDGTGIPIPALLHRGRLGDLYYAISRKAHGTPVSDLAPDAQATLVPALAGMLDAIHAVDVEGTSGYGPAGDDGNGLFPSWPAYLTAVREEEPEWDFYGRWHVLFDTTFLQREVFDRAFAAMERLLPSCPEERSLIHGNYGFGNVLAADGQITAVLDWQEAGYGDPLLDVAQLDFWDAGTDWADVFLERYVQRDATVSHFAERVRCYQLHTGLDALRFFAKKGDEGAYRWVRDRLDAIAAG